MNTRAEKPRLAIFLICLGIALIAFLIFLWPNLAASKDLAMVSMFEPDEGVLVPYIQRMIAPVQGVSPFLHQFIFYDYYFYGFPFFAFSALISLPLKWLGLLGDMTVFMGLQRQLVSVLPMIAAILTLVYLQDHFRSYRSPVLLVFLLAIPAVVQNNFWWHPDGLTILFTTLTLFFLVRDDLRFGRNFIFAAIFTGLAAAIKLVGLYYFLAVGLTLVLGLFLRKCKWQKLLGMGAAYILTMFFVYIAANPFLLSHWARDTYLNIFQQQTFLLSEGYGIVYEKGVAAVLPQLQEFYGSWWFLLIPIGVSIFAAIKGPKRLLHALILAWFLPITVTVFFFTHFKFQYWLPVALPLFSSLAVLLPVDFRRDQFLPKKYWLRSFLFLLVILQMGIFLVSDIMSFVERGNRAENNARIDFYSQAVGSLAPLQNTPLQVYYDYRLYVPETRNWTASSTYDLLDYDYVEKGNFDVLLLLEQRIRDYLNPAAVGIDPSEFRLSRAFYQDAESGSLRGYRLLFRNDTGLIFIRDSLYSQYFQK